MDERLPTALGWVFSTPGWVPGLLATLLTLWLMWVSWPHTRNVSPSAGTQAPTPAPIAVPFVETSSKVDLSFLSNAVWIFEHDLGNAELHDASPYVSARFVLCNGSGFPLEFTQRFKGRAAIGPIAIFEDVSIHPFNWSGIEYPGLMTFSIKVGIPKGKAAEIEAMKSDSSLRTKARGFGVSPYEMQLVTNDLRVAMIAATPNGPVEFDVSFPYSTTIALH